MVLNIWRQKFTPREAGCHFSEPEIRAAWWRMFFLMSGEVVPAISSVLFLLHDDAWEDGGGFADDVAFGDESPAEFVEAEFGEFG